VRQWVSLRVNQQRTTTEEPKKLLPKHGLTPRLEADEGATAPSPSQPRVSNKDGNGAHGKGADASMPPRDFWKESWDSYELGDTRRALLRGRSGVSKPKDLFLPIVTTQRRCISRPRPTRCVSATRLSYSPVEASFVGKGGNAAVSSVVTQE